MIDKKSRLINQLNKLEIQKKEIEKNIINDSQQIFQNLRKKLRTNNFKTIKNIKNLLINYYDDKTINDKTNTIDTSILIKKLNNFINKLENIVNNELDITKFENNIKQYQYENKIKNEIIKKHKSNNKNNKIKLLNLEKTKINNINKENEIHKNEVIRILNCIEESNTSLLDNMYTQYDFKESLIQKYQTLNRELNRVEKEILNSSFINRNSRKEMLQNIRQNKINTIHFNSNIRTIDSEISEIKNEINLIQMKINKNKNTETDNNTETSINYSKLYKKIINLNREIDTLNNKKKLITLDFKTKKSSQPKIVKKREILILKNKRNKLKQETIDLKYKIDHFIEFYINTQSDNYNKEIELLMKDYERANQRLLIMLQRYDEEEINNKVILNNLINETNDDITNIQIEISKNNDEINQINQSIQNSNQLMLYIKNEISKLNLFNNKYNEFIKDIQSLKKIIN